MENPNLKWMMTGLPPLSEINCIPTLVLQHIGHVNETRGAVLFQDAQVVASREDQAKRRIVVLWIVAPRHEVVMELMVDFRLATDADAGG